MKTDGAHPIDIHVGSRVRLRRNMLGLSQEKLGEAVGVTFQQVQKYERGTNRIGASRLLEIARALDVPILFFYGDVDAAHAVPIEDILYQPETAELVAAYYGVVSLLIRRQLFQLLRALSGAA